MTTYPISTDRRPADPPALRLSVVLGAFAVLLAVLLVTDSISFAAHGADRTVEQVRSGGSTGDRISQVDRALAELGQ